MEKSELIKMFKKYLSDRDSSETTIKGYLQDLDLISSWFEKQTGEEFLPESITRSDIRDYKQYMLTEENRKANTINRHLAALTSFLDWAQEAGYINENPATSIKSVPQVQGGPQYLNRKEQNSLQRAIERDLQISKIRYPKRWVSHQRDISLVIFLLHTGLRLSEALSLRVSDINLLDRKGEVIIHRGKGLKQRKIPLNSEARKAISDWLQVRPGEKSGYVWIAVENERNGSLSGRSVQRVIHRIGQDAGIDRLTPHILRHTFGKNLVDKGVGLEKVAALLGHASLNTTKIYVVPNQQDLEKAVEKISMEY